MLVISSMPGIFSFSFISLPIGGSDGRFSIVFISSPIDPIGVGDLTEIVSIAGILVGCGKLFGGSSEYEARFCGPSAVYVSLGSLLFAELTFEGAENFVLRSSFLLTKGKFS